MALCVGGWTQNRQAIVETRMWKEGTPAGPESVQMLRDTASCHSLKQPIRNVKFSVLNTEKCMLNVGRRFKCRRA